MTKDELTKALYLFRDLWCQNIDISTIDEFVDDYTQQQVKNLNIPAVINRRELLVAFLREYHTSMLVLAEMPDIETIVDDYLKSN